MTEDEMLQKDGFILIPPEELWDDEQEIIDLDAEGKKMERQAIEGTPHLHLLVQFVGEGYVKGLSHQVSISKALQCDGFERGGSRRTGYSLSRWAKDVEDNVMEPLLKFFREEREILDEKRPHDDTAVFRVRAKQEELYMQQESENKRSSCSSVCRYRMYFGRDCTSISFSSFIEDP